MFYKKGIIYLGTQKSVTNELHAIDVSLPTSPHELSTAEIGNAVNDLFAFKDRLYVATPNNEELKVFQINPDGTLMLLSVFDAPGGSGNGKRLSLFLNTLYLGRTVGKDELFALSASSSPLVKNFSFPIAASIEGVFGYGSLLYILSTNTSDGFGVYDSALATSTRVNVKVGFPLTPIGFDCDQNTFYISLENSRLIYVIKPSL